MFRKILGKAVEWALGYEREVIFAGFYMVGENSCAPRRSHSDDAGYDVYVSERTVILSHQVKEVPSGIAVDPKARIWLEIKARSSTFHKLGLEVLDAVIDRGYRGDLFAVVYNPGGTPVIIEPGMRICQLVPHLLLPCKFKAGKLSFSDRMQRGFGSSGR